MHNVVIVVIIIVFALLTLCYATMSQFIQYQAFMLHYINPDITCSLVASSVILWTLKCI